MSLADPDAEPPADDRPWPRRPRRLATAVVGELVDRIVGGRIAEGAALPPEPSLCEQFGVSRTVVREAVKSLEGMRLVSVQQGAGTRVRPFAEWRLLDPVVLAATVRHDAESAILDDLVDVRRALEAQMAARAATRATAADLAAIEAAMARLEAETEDPARYLVADVAFHDAVMAASGNRLGRATVRTLTAEAFRSLRYVGDPTAADCRHSNEAHRAVLAHVRARDAEAAGSAMNDHILEAWQRRRPAS
jgi:GntR family galactonate operon transcriptional repressor